MHAGLEDDEPLDISSFSTKHQRQRMVPSLKKISVFIIASNIDKWVEQLSNNQSQFGSLSPFDALGSMDVMAILRELSELHLFQNPQLRIIFHHNLKEMDFTLIRNYLVKDATLKVLNKKCKKLHTLKIGFASLSPKTQMMIPAWYPNIQHLHLGFAIKVSVSNKILRICKNLRTIHLLQQTDEFPMLEIDNNTIRSFSLKALQSCRLPCKSTKVKFMCMLGKLQKLYSLSLKGFSNLHFYRLCHTRDQVDFSNLASLKLSTISVRDMTAITKIMENIISLEIRNCLFDNEIFLNISNMKSLKFLTLSFGNYVDFNNNFKSCLYKVGKQLESLCLLSGVSYVDTSIVGACCPNLKTFCLENGSVVYFNWIHPEKMRYSNLTDSHQDKLSFCQACPSLEKLVLNEFHNLTENGNDVDDDYSPLFQGTNRLKVLSITNIIPSASSESFESIFEKFDLSYVEILDVSYNFLVTKHTILRILKNLPRLKVLRTTGLTKEETDVFNKLIGDHYLDVVLET